MMKQFTLNTHNFITDGVETYDASCLIKFPVQNLSEEEKEKVKLFESSENGDFFKWPVTCFNLQGDTEKILRSLITNAISVLAMAEFPENFEERILELRNKYLPK